MQDRDGRETQKSLEDELLGQFSFRLPIRLKKKFKVALAEKDTDGAKYLRDCVERFVSEANMPLVH